MTIAQHGTQWPGQQNTVVYSTQGIKKKKNFLCAESLSSSQSHVPLFFFTSSWLESKVCSIFVCFWCVCGWSRKYPYYIVFKSCSMNESYIVWCFMMLIQIIIMLISYFEYVLLVFACNLNSKAASHLFCNLSYSENEPWGHCIFGTLHSSCWMSRLQNIEALPLADFLSELWECVDHIKFICVNNIREYIFIGIVYRIQHW